MTNLVGQHLGNYQLVRLLGEGGFGTVYLGEHIHLRTLAAIKVLQTRLGQESYQEFLHEARTVAQLEHPHILRVLDFGIESQSHTPFLVMVYAQGGTLRQRYPRGTRVPVETVVSYINQVASALQYAHDRKYVHRDVKPENLLISHQDEVLLSDFGIALFSQSSSPPDTQPIKGTAAYMAPEQLQGHPVPASDQYALGIVAYEWLSGERPFNGTFLEVSSQHLFAPPVPLNEKNPALSAAMAQVVQRALAKKPQDRFPTVQSFADALAESLQASIPTLASQQSTIKSAPPFHLAIESPSMQPLEQSMHELSNTLPVTANQKTTLLAFSAPESARDQTRKKGRGARHIFFKIGAVGCILLLLAVLVPLLHFSPKLAFPLQIVRSLSAPASASHATPTPQPQSTPVAPSSIPVGPQISGQPIIGAHSNGELDVFYQGSDNYLWETSLPNTSSTSWTSPVRLTGFGQVGSAPSITVLPTGTQDIYWRGTDNELWEGRCFVKSGCERSPIHLGLGPLGSSPSATSWEQNGTIHQDVVWRGFNSNELRVAEFDGTHWIGPVHIAGMNLGSRPTIGAHSDGELDVFWKGTDNNLWEAYWAPDSHGWIGPVKWGMGPLGSAPSVTVRSSGEQDVYWRSYGNNAYGLWNMTCFVGGGCRGPFNEGASSVSSVPSATNWGYVNDVAWQDTSGKLVIEQFIFLH